MQLQIFAVKSIAFRKIEIVSKLQFDLCKEKYIELLEMMENQVANPAVKEVIQSISNIIKNKKAPETLKENKNLATKINNLQKILNALRSIK